MTNLTLNGWKETVATGVVEAVPLQTFESAFLLAENFLADEGGWIPDDAGDPSGTGVPASGISTGDAISAIADEQAERTHRIAIEGNLNFRIVLMENQNPSLSDEDILTNITDRLTEIVDENLTTTRLEFVDLPSFTGDITNGPTTQSQRVDIENNILAGGQQIDPQTIALIAGRASFDLDDTYNVVASYTEPDKQLFVLMQKYTDKNYTDLDTATDNNQYGISLDTVSLKVGTGVTITRS